MHIHSPKELALLAIQKRKQLGLTQSQLGELVGLRQKSISAFENKPEHTQLETLFRILAALQLDIEIADKNTQKISKKSWNQEW